MVRMGESSFLWVNGVGRPVSDGSLGCYSAYSFAEVVEIAFYPVV